MRIKAIFRKWPMGVQSKSPHILMSQPQKVWDVLRVRAAHTHGDQRGELARVLWSVPSVERCVLRLHVACRCTCEAYKAQENQERIYNIYARQPTPPDISPGVGRKACGAIKQRELTVCPRPAVTAPEPRRPRGVFTSTDAAWPEAAAVPSRHLRGTASAASNAGQPRRAPR